MVKTARLANFILLCLISEVECVGVGGRGSQSV